MVEKPVTAMRLVLALATSIVIASLAQAAPRPAPPVFNRASALFPAGDPVRGKVLSAQCLACHGDAEVLLDQPPFHPPKLRYQRAASIFYALQDYREGRRKSDLMTPIAKALSEQDMRDLSVVLSAGPNRRRGAEPGGPKLANSWGHEKDGELCGLCHGEAGLGVMEGYPALAGQNQDYLEHALNAYRSGARSNPIMQVFARSLAPDEVARIAAYFAAQPGLEPNR